MKMFQIYIHTSKWKFHLVIWPRRIKVNLHTALQPSHPFFLQSFQKQKNEIARRSKETEGSGLNLKPEKQTLYSNCLKAIV